MQRVFLTLIVLLVWICAKAQKQAMPADTGNVVKELYFEGVREKLKENYATASTHFNKIISLQPKNDAVLFELASIHYKQNKLVEAESFIKKAIVLNPQNIWYLNMLAELQKRANNMTGLIATFDLMIALAPEKEDYYFDRANAWFIAGNSEEALKGYDLVEKKFGASPALTQARQRIRMEGKAAPENGEIEQLIAENPDDIRNYLYLSGVLLQKNKKAEALALLRKAEGVAGANYEVQLAIADIYRSNKDAKNAYVALKKAFEATEMPLDQKVKIVVMALPDLANAILREDVTELAEITAKMHPTEAKAFALFGDVLYRQHNLNGARQQYAAALKLNDQVYAVWEQLIGILINLGNYKEAIKMGEEALSIYPNQAILYYYQAFSQHRTGESAAAISNIKYSLQLDADNKALKAMTFALQGEIYIDQNKLAAADEAFDKALALDPANFGLVNNYAYYLALRDQNLNKALTLISKAATARPDDQSIAHTYAFVLFKMQKYDAAKEWIEKAVQNNAAINPVYLEHLGDILFFKGEKDAAVVAWQTSKDAGNESDKLNRKINEKKYIK